MKRLVFILLLLLASPAWADSAREKFQRGWDAYHRGDYATALKEWRPLAVQGDAHAQHNLGNMYSKGKGVTQDYQTAISWFCKAVKQGHASAMNNLGATYITGEGVIQNYVQAHKWFNLAAARKKPGEDRDRSVNNRGFAASKMTPADISQAQRLPREWTDDKPCP